MTNACRKISPKKGKKVTTAYIESRINSIEYIYLDQSRVTVCVIQMDNEFSVCGESACIDPTYYDQKIQEKQAHASAFSKLWQLCGFSMVDKNIAKVCHEANKAYCEALGDYSQESWEDAPEWQKDSIQLGVELHLSGDFGPEASHESWMDNKLKAGWVHGKVKNSKASPPTHPCLVPFEHLPLEQKVKDYVFRAIVHALGK